WKEHRRSRLLLTNPTNGRMELISFPHCPHLSTSAVVLERSIASICGLSTRAGMTMLGTAQIGERRDHSRVELLLRGQLRVTP
ncbi:MAG: hypothetical protein ACRD6W_14310, partial [Nitrososphaerales archaeon]